MSQVKRAKARRSKTALSVLSLAGLSLAATTATTSKSVAGMPSPATTPVQAFTLGEEEISDVTLATFHLFDKDSVEQSRSILHLTACRGGCGCGGRGGCRGGGCRVRRMPGRRLRMPSRRMRMPGRRMRMGRRLRRMRRSVVSVLGRVQALVLSVSCAV